MKKVVILCGIGVVVGTLIVLEQIADKQFKCDQKRIRLKDRTKNMIELDRNLDHVGEFGW